MCEPHNFEPTLRPLQMMLTERIHRRRRPCASCAAAWRSRSGEPARYSVKSSEVTCLAKRRCEKTNRSTRTAGSAMLSHLESSVWC